MDSTRVEISEDEFFVFRAPNNDPLALFQLMTDAK